MAVLSRQDTGRLFVRSVAVPDPGDLLRQLPQPDAVAWVHHGVGLVGWGEALRATLPAGEDRFAAGQKWLPSLFDAAEVDDQVRVRGSGLVAFGAFTFDESSEGSVLIVPRVLLGRDGRGQAWLTTVSPGGTTPPVTPPIMGGLPVPPSPPGRRECAGTTVACPGRSGSRPSPRR